MNKELILREIKSHLGYTKDSDFARFLGLKTNTLANWFARGTFDMELIYTKCEWINPHWLLTGEGEMLLTGEEKNISEIEDCKQCKELKKEIDLLKQIIEAKNETIKALQNKDSNESSKR